MNYRLSDEAWRDLRAIADYILDDNPARSVSFIAELIEKIEVIAERPESFPVRDEWLLGMRSALHGKYLILFELDADVVHILRVIHGARNVAAMFRGGAD